MKNILGLSTMLALLFFVLFSHKEEAICQTTSDGGKALSKSPVITSITSDMPFMEIQHENKLLLSPADGKQSYLGSYLQSDRQSDHAGR